MRKIQFSILLIFSCLFIGYSQNLADRVRNNHYTFFEIMDTAAAYFDEKYEGGEPTFKTKQYEGPDGLIEFQKIDGEYAKYKRWEWFWRDRLLPDSTFPDLKTIYESRVNQKTNLKTTANQTSALTWTNINQTESTGGYNGMGRTTSIAFHPSNPNVFYVGAPVGGIWKTTDGGQSYTSLGDKLPYVSVGNICVDHQNPNTIYITIGDHLGWWNYSLGVYKSTDGGETWNPTGFQQNFEDGMAIYKMAMHPSNPAILMLATTRGLFRSADAGATWFRVRNGEHRDVEFSPNNGNIVFAAFSDWWSTSEVYKSYDAGQSFQQKTSLNSDNNSIILTISSVNPNVVAFLTRKEKAFYLSTDGGESFSFKSNVDETDVIYASPNDEHTFYCGYVNVYKSTNDGNSWNQITIWHGGGGYPEVHADQRNMGHNPLNNYLYFCNDGGIYQYNEPANQWTEYSRGLVITQFYRIAVAQTHPEIMIGGTQDNGGRRRRADGTWTATNGGDAMEVAIDPTNENIIYTTYINGQLYRSMDAWRNDVYHDIRNNIPGQPEGDWVTPYVLDPNTPSSLIAGYKEVYRSLDRGDNWQQLSNNLTGGRNLQAIAVAEGNSSIIYTSEGNRFFATFNDGQNWNSHTFNDYDRITSIIVDPHNTQKVYATFAGYRAGKKVSYSTDGGQTWADFSGSLPNVPANSFVIDANGDDACYVGTDYGVFYRDASMTDWIKYGEGLPNTNVTDLEIQKNTSMLRIATFGRGVWEIPLWSKAVVLKETDAVPLGRKKGVRYVYYEDDFRLLPDFAALKAIRETHGGVVNDIALTGIPHHGANFAVEYDAYIYAPEDGLYNFYISSDDGTRLFIGDQLLINHDGVHGQTEMVGNIGLKQGYHKLRVEYFQGVGGLGLNLNWAGPIFERRGVENDVEIASYQHDVAGSFQANNYQYMYGLHERDDQTLMGWIDANDTITYEINASERGYYDVLLNYAAPSNNRELNLLVDGELKIESVLPTSEGWGIQKEFNFGDVLLTAGVHTITLVIGNGGLDYYDLTLEKINKTPQAYFTSPTITNNLTGTVLFNVIGYDPDAGESDGDGVTNVVFQILKEGNVEASKTESIITYDWNLETANYPNGDYVMRATVNAADGGSIIKEVSFTINNYYDCQGILDGAAYLDDCNECVINEEEACIQDCYGDWGGGAYEDACGKCAGGNTGIIPITNSEACVPTGVHELTTEEVQIYPNPFRQSLIIDAEQLVEVDIYSTTGILLYSQSNVNGWINTRFLPEGTYLVKVSMDDRVITRLLHKK